MEEIAQVRQRKAQPFVRYPPTPKLTKRHRALRGGEQHERRDVRRLKERRADPRAQRVQVHRVEVWPVGQGGRVPKHAQVERAAQMASIQEDTGATVQDKLDLLRRSERIGQTVANVATHEVKVAGDLR